jgi:hypothetical protein
MNALLLGKLFEKVSGRSAGISNYDDHHVALMCAVRALHPTLMEGAISLKRGFVWLI